MRPALLFLPSPSPPRTQIILTGCQYQVLKPSCNVMLCYCSQLIKVPLFLLLARLPVSFNTHNLPSLPSICPLHWNEVYFFIIFYIFFSLFCPTSSFSYFHNQSFSFIHFLLMRYFSDCSECICSTNAAITTFWRFATRLFYQVSSSCH